MTAMRALAGSVEGAQVSEQVGGRLGEIAVRAEIEQLAARRRAARGPKASRASSPATLVAFSRTGPRRRVVAVELAGRFAGGVAARDGVAQRHGSDHRLDRLARGAAGAQQRRHGRREIEHRRFQADLARSAVEDQLHPVAQRFGDMLGACRADGAAAVGRRSRRSAGRRRGSAPAPSDGPVRGSRRCRGRPSPAARWASSLRAAAPGSAVPARSVRRACRRRRSTAPGASPRRHRAHGRSAD